MSHRENLQFYVLEEVQAPVFQTLGNLKVITSYAFSWLLLGTRLRAHQGVAIGLLVSGSLLLRCSIVWIGLSRLLAILTLVSCSGLNLVLYEQLLKRPRLSTHAANVGFYACSVAMHGVLAAHTGSGFQAHLTAFSTVEWATVGGQVLNGACNSMLVAGVGAIGKQFISQGAVITLTLLGAASRADPFVVTPTFAAGSVCVFAGVWAWKFGLPLCRPCTTQTTLTAGGAATKAAHSDRGVEEQAVVAKTNSKSHQHKAQHKAQTSPYKVRPRTRQQVAVHARTEAYPIH